VTKLTNIVVVVVVDVLPVEVGRLEAYGAVQNELMVTSHQSIL